MTGSAEHSSSVKGNVWARSAGDFAVRIEVRDLDGILKKTLLVESGTIALLFQKGEMKGVLEPGRHTLETLRSRLKTLNYKDATNAILIDSGHLEVPLRVGRVLTQEKVEVGCSLNAVVRLVDAVAFHENLFKSAKRMTAGDIGTYLVDEARTVVAEIIATVPVDALSGNTSLTRELEVTLQSELARVLEGSGLELARVRFVEFEAEVADDIRRGEGALALRKRRAELNHRIRELLTQEKLDEFRSGKELEDFLRQIELEMGMRDLIRDEEMQRLKDDVGHGLDVRLLTQRLELEEIEDDAERERRRRVLDEAIETAADLRGDDKAQHEHELDKDRAEHELRQKKAQDAADLLAQMKERKLQGKRETLEMQREHEAALLEQRSAATTEALISIVGGSDAGEQLARLEELRVKQNMTPDQLLPIVAAEAPHLAEALTEKYRAEGLASEEVLRMATDRAEELKELHRETQDRTERFTQMVLQQMGQVAMTRAQGPPAPQTVVAGAGGLGPPVVIGGAAQAQPQQPAASAARTCGHCGASMDGGASFCPVCAKRID